MLEKKPEDRTILDSLYKHRKVYGRLILSLLVLLNILVLMYALPFFNPVRKFLEIVTTPIIVAVIFFYIFKPLHQKFLNLKIPKNWAAIAVFVVIVTVFAVTIGILIPTMNQEVGRLVADFPAYWDGFIESLNGILRHYDMGTVQEQFGAIFEKIVTAVNENMGSILSDSFIGVKSILSSLFRFGIVLFTFPIILFYLFRDGERLPAAILKLVPTKWIPITKQIFADIDEQLSLYIRGQIIVCFWVGVMFFIGYTIIGLPYALLLAIFAGALNIIPYLGSFIAIVPSMIIGIADSPFLFIQVLLVFAVEQTIESRVVAPKVLGDNLNIHPATILLVLLTSGRLFGISGVIVGVPTYAILKSIFQHAFRYLKMRTKLYDTD